MESKREIWIDWLRVISCFMVMVVHSTEPFYLGGDGALVQAKADAFWVPFFEYVTRACVPLFLIASSYLLFPVQTNTGSFFKRRLVRILIPFVLWSLIYAFMWGEPVSNLKDLLLNFNYSAGHLWFVYMILGLYLIMPLLSPWAEKVGKKELQAYLGIWLFTTLIPFIKDYAIGAAYGISTGPTGIPYQYNFPLWGEASWNSYGTFYYVSGAIGFLLLGLYFKKFVPELNWKKTLAWAVPLLVGGFAICFFGFRHRILSAAGGGFPVAAGLDVAVRWETPLFNDTLGVAMMTAAWILILRHFKRETGFYRRIVLPVSKVSYGMYLGHMSLLVLFSGLWRGTFGVGEGCLLGFWTTPVEILLTAVCSYVCIAVAMLIVSRIPKAGKYLV